MKSAKSFSNYLVISYIFLIVLVFLYSFTQIDLSLTFSRITFLRNLVKSFQYIGYFNRPLSTYFYCALLIFLFGFYTFFLYFAYLKKIDKHFLWKIVIITAVILTFSYNAFSYDLFNYIFDAKIITHYFQNPYMHKALDYPHDPMLSFMHWTQRTYPYGPVWLLLTVPLSFLGLQLFLPTVFLFKAVASLSYLGTAYFLGKIVKRFFPEKELFSIIFFALNPLVILESLVSAHNDIVMVFLAVISLYLLLSRRYMVSILLFLASIGIKFATVFLAPVYIGILFLQIKKKHINWKEITLSILIFMSIALVVVTMRTNFQPWYLLYILPFAAFLSFEYYIFLPSIILSFFALLTYVPFLYLGNWDKPVPQILTDVYIIGLIASAISVTIFFFSKLFLKKM